MKRTLTLPDHPRRSATTLRNLAKSAQFAAPTRAGTGVFMDSADFDALEGEARTRMAPSAFAFALAGADDEITAQENAMRWRALRLRPRVLSEATQVDTRTTILGRPALPIMVAPMGRHRLFHPDGEIATARGAAAA